MLVSKLKISLCQNAAETNLNIDMKAQPSATGKHPLIASLQRRTPQSLSTPSDTPLVLQSSHSISQHRLASLRKRILLLLGQCSHFRVPPLAPVSQLDRPHRAHRAANEHTWLPVGREKVCPHTDENKVVRVPFLRTKINPSVWRLTDHLASTSTDENKSVRLEADWSLGLHIHGRK